MERDPVVGLQEGDEVDGRLFEAEPGAGAGMLLAQFQQPFPQGFGRSVNHHAAALAGAGVNEAEVGLLIGTIQADDQVIRRCSHSFFLSGFPVSRGLDLATPI